MRQLGTEYFRYAPLTILGAPTGTALDVYGPTNNTDYCTVLHSGITTALFQPIPVLRLRVTSGTGGFGGNGATMYLDAWNNNNPATAAPVAAVGAYLVNGGGGGNDHAGSLAIYTKNTIDSFPQLRGAIGSTGGFFMGTPAGGQGGDMGYGTINCQALYVNGVAVTVP